MKNNFKLAVNRVLRFLSRKAKQCLRCPFSKRLSSQGQLRCGSRQKRILGLPEMLCDLSDVLCAGRLPADRSAGLPRTAQDRKTRRQGSRQTQGDYSHHGGTDDGVEIHNLVDRNAAIAAGGQRQLSENSISMFSLPVRYHSWLPAVRPYVRHTQTFDKLTKKANYHRIPVLGSINLFHCSLDNNVDPLTRSLEQPLMP